MYASKHVLLTFNTFNHFFHLRKKYFGLYLVQVIWRLPSFTGGGRPPGAPACIISDTSGHPSRTIDVS